MAGQALSPAELGRECVVEQHGERSGAMPSTALPARAGVRTDAQTNSSFTVDMGTALRPSTRSRWMRARRRTTSRATIRCSFRTTGRISELPLATGTGTGQLVTINLLTQTARFIKIQTPSTPADSNTWSIQELSIWRIAQPCDSITCSGVGRMPRRRGLQPEHGRLLGPGLCNDGATFIDSNACTTEGRPATRPNAPVETPAHLHRRQKMPQRRNVQPVDGMYRGGERAQRHGVQRRQRLHNERRLRRRDLSGWGPPFTCQPP